MHSDCDRVRAKGGLRLLGDSGRAVLKRLIFCRGAFSAPGLRSKARALLKPLEKLSRVTVYVLNRFGLLLPACGCDRGWGPGGEDVMGVGLRAKSGGDEDMEKMDMMQRWQFQSHDSGCKDANLTRSLNKLENSRIERHVSGGHSKCEVNSLCGSDQSIRSDLRSPRLEWAESVGRVQRSRDHVIETTPRSPRFSRLQLRCCSARPQPEQRSIDNFGPLYSLTGWAA